MNRSEKLIYHHIIGLAMRKLARYNKHLPPDRLEQRSVFTDFVIVKWPQTGLKYMIKLCPQYYERGKVELTGPELRLLSGLAGVVFIMGKAPPSRTVAECDYDVVLVDGNQIMEETANHLKGVDNACFMPFRFQYHPSRILANGVLI